MPELPEVEATVRQLNHSVRDRMIRDIRVLDLKLIRPFSPKKFETCLKHSYFRNARRRGKFIILETSTPYALLIHLRMTGSFAFGDSNLPSSFVRLVFHTSERHQLVFRDPRRFGTVRLVKKDLLESRSELKSLGVEPFSREFTLPRFYEILQSSSQPVKNRLMNQKAIVGLGNIYSQEALFLARIHPGIRSNQISKLQAQKLRDAILKILIRSIDQIRQQMNRFPELVHQGGFGAFENLLRVYDRAGKKCYRCRSRIQKMKQGQRTTCYCPRCQKMPIHGRRIYN